MKTLFSMAALGLACFLVMGNTGCQHATVPAASVGLGYVGTAPPSASTAGTWVHTSGSGSSAHWLFLAASGAAASAALAKAVDNSRFIIEATHDNVTHLAWVKDPCSSRHGDYPLSNWPSPLSQLKINLNCAGLRKIISHSKKGGRLKNLYNCIGNIIRNGTHSYNAVFRQWTFFLDTGKVYVTINGQVTDVYPIGGDWKTCAQAE